MDCSPPGTCPWNSPDKNTGVGCQAVPSGDLSNPGIEPRSPALQADSLPAEPQGEPSIHPSNLAPGEGVGALSLVLQQGGGLSREGLTAFSVSEQMDTVLTS